MRVYGQVFMAKFNSFPSDNYTELRSPRDNSLLHVHQTISNERAILRRHAIHWDCSHCIAPKSCAIMLASKARNTHTHTFDHLPFNECVIAALDDLNEQWKWCEISPNIAISTSCRAIWRFKFAIVCMETIKWYFPILYMNFVIANM